MFIVIVFNFYVYIELKLFLKEKEKENEKCNKFFFPVVHPMGAHTFRPARRRRKECGSRIGVRDKEHPVLRIGSMGFLCIRTSHGRVVHIYLL